MPLIKQLERFGSSGRPIGFNLTPVIDIVFLLIIFFCVVCHFIEAENFPVAVPDRCDFAESAEQPGSQITTLTVTKADDSQCRFAVGPEMILGSDSRLTEKLAHLLDSRLSTLSADSRTVTLRIDKGTPYAHAQYALAAVAQSSATNIRLASFKEEHAGIE